MGNATSRSTKTKSTTPNGETIGGGMARGETIKIGASSCCNDEIAATTFESVITFPSDEDTLSEESFVSYEADEEEDDDDEEEEEEDEEMAERLRILDDARKLKQLAEAFLYPERPVVTTDAAACGRNYFDRPSAKQVPEEEEEERIRIMEDVMALKKLAVDYAHPEIGVVTSDPHASGRNYFDRAAAPEETEERDLILEDMAALKKLAVDYAHPEIGVVTSDPRASGRNYFDRASAPEETEGRDLILEDVAALKKLAVDYAHPEIGIVTSDPHAPGRNYFDRASAPEETEERDLILEDMAALKKLAADYLHPEVGVFPTDKMACSRNYFGRASAPEQESLEEMEERARVLEELSTLKKLSVDYAHPEMAVASEASVFGRSYFGRFSSPEQMSVEEAEEYESFLVDAMHLKQFAMDFMHPEMVVVTSDETATARNYFDRASAEEAESFEDAEERARIMQEIQMLKKLAVDYSHPELPVITTDATSRGRNYFVRFSASGHSCISSTREENVKIVNDDEEDYFVENDCDLEFGEFEKDVLADWKYQVHEMLDRSHYSTPDRPMTKEEEDVVLSRSPSSVMLFGGYAS